jgi:hypothetical protein
VPGDRDVESRLIEPSRFTPGGFLTSYVVAACADKTVLRAVCWRATGLLALPSRSPWCCAQEIFWSGSAWG